VADVEKDQPFRSALKDWQNLRLMRLDLIVSVSLPILSLPLSLTTPLIRFPFGTLTVADQALAVSPTLRV
jgi:hypothetical protein